MRVGFLVGSNLPTGWDALKAWVAAGLPVAAVALPSAAEQHSRGVVPSSLFHVPDSVLAADTHDSREALLRRERARCHRALADELPHRAGAQSDTAAFHPVAR